MSSARDPEFFHLRTEGKTYISKVFQKHAQAERLRYVRMVLEGCDELHLGEIEGALCLRLDGQIRKTQVTALVSQDSRKVRRLTLQTFKTRKDFIHAVEEHEFTFRHDEFARLQDFLTQIEFLDLNDEHTSRVVDMSSGKGPRVVIDAPDRSVVELLKGLSGSDRMALLQSLEGSLSPDDVNLLLGRKQGLDLFEHHLTAGEWREKDWQEFFDREQWVFGYGLDYQIMGIFDREMVVGGGGTDNRNKPTVDFLGEAANYTVLVEIKTPGTTIFKARAGGRAGTWDFTPEFISAVSQVLEQKAEWVANAQFSEDYSKDGSRLLSRTRSPKAILVVGSSAEFEANGNDRDAQLKSDTFELFRRDTRSMDIMTFDELIQRARFITKNAR